NSPGTALARRASTMKTACVTSSATSTRRTCRSAAACTKLPWRTTISAKADCDLLRTNSASSSRSLCSIHKTMDDGRRCRHNSEDFARPTPAKRSDDGNCRLAKLGAAVDVIAPSLQHIEQIASRVGPQYRRAGSVDSRFGAQFVKQLGIAAKHHP